MYSILQPADIVICGFCLFLFLEKANILSVMFCYNLLNNVLVTKADSHKA